MKKRMIKNLLLTVIMAVLCFAVCVTASAQDRTVIDSGECGARGDNVIWTLYDDGELVISGEGEMEDYAETYDRGYSARSADWYGYEINKVTIENGITRLGGGVFYCDNRHAYSFKTIDLPESIKSIGAGAFDGCENLEEIEIPDSVTVIEGYAFSGCKNLKNIEIPASITRINTHTFGACDSLTSIDIPDSVTFIETCAFYNSVNIETINVGSGVAVIEEFAFDACLKLSKITVDENNANFSCDEYGVLFNKNKTELIKFPMGSAEDKYVIPNSVTTICDCSFLFCFDLNNVVIPDSVTNIGMYAFCFCIDLANIAIPNSVTDVGEGAYAFCASVTEIVIPEGTKNIVDMAFMMMPFLEKITVKSMDVNLGGASLGASDFVVEGISSEEFSTLYLKAFLFPEKEAVEKLEQYMTYVDGVVHIGTLYCHSDSTAEDYAIENGIDYVLTHFYEGDWTYDYENGIKYRKCIHCDEKETEALESETPDGPTVPDEPVTPDEPITPDEPQVETKDNFFTKLIDLIKSFFELITSWFNG